MYDDILDVEFWAGHVSAQNYKAKAKGKYFSDRASVHLFVEVEGQPSKVAVCGFKGHIDPDSLRVEDYYPERRLCKNCISSVKFSRKMADALMLLRTCGHYGELDQIVYAKLNPPNYPHSSRNVGRGNRTQHVDYSNGDLGGNPG
jgi:hypothetical protein